MSETPTTAVPAKILTDSKVEWDKPLQSSAADLAPPKEWVEHAMKLGERRKKIVKGEMLVVLGGGCVFDDDFGEPHAEDTVVIPAKNRYGFTCGPQGMEFLTIRLGEANTEF